MGSTKAIDGLTTVPDCDDAFFNKFSKRCVIKSGKVLGLVDEDQRILRELGGENSW